MTTSKILIVYYSRTGATRRLAEALAKALHADIEPIVDSKCVRITDARSRRLDVSNFAQSLPWRKVASWAQKGRSLLPMQGTKMHMSNESLLIILMVGLIAGWLAGQIVQGTGFGVLGDLLVGIIGAFIGSWLLPQLGIHLGLGILAAIINATIGALVLLLIIRLIRGGGGGRGSRGRRW